MRAGIGVRMMRTGLLMAAAAGLLWVSGCGGGSTTTAGQSTATAGASKLEGLTAAQVLAATRAAAKSAKSVHVTGKIANGSDTISLDLSIVDGVGGKGTITQNGSTAEVILVGDEVYLKGDKSLYESTLGANAAEIIKLIGDKYMKAPASNAQFSSFSSLFRLGDFVDGVLKADGKISRVAGKDVDGTPTVGLKDDDLQDGGILYIADAEPPLPLLIESLEGAKDAGSIRFSEWGATPSITAPPDDQVIDIGKLTRS